MMKIKRYLHAFGLLAVSPLVLVPGISQAGSHCKSCEQGNHFDSGYSIESGSFLIDDGSRNPYINHRAYSGQVKRVSPPPKGNLGVTFRRPSRLIDWDEHPRVAGLEITLPPDVTRGTVKEGEGLQVQVSVQDHRNRYEPVEGYVGKDDRWHFITDPLIPGNPHIFDIKVDLVRVKKMTERRWGRNYEVQVEKKVRTIGNRRVRLVRGRIIELAF
ncbi:hypothetical protein MNBD_PLANCTO02-3405 [hydrothermal vent metagenome]|uniref:Uncharacterized protein n=1 Tax=hydrothermal vent metagenome TaxID=652676 RepID=A0A3B1D8S9_9ZZZZ